MEELIAEGLLQLDIEFGNAHGFFSASKARPDFYEQGTWMTARCLNGSIPAAHLQMKDEVICEPLGLNRICSFTPIADAWLFDLVSRFVVIDTGGERTATINGIDVPHRDVNLYRQYPAGEAVVPVGNKGWLAFSGTEQGMPDGLFEHVFYIRDEGRDAKGCRWIVHHRVVGTLAAQKLTLRGCNPRFDGPAPEWLERRVPLWLKAYLFRIRERRYPSCPMMVVGESLVPMGHQISLRTSIAFSKE